MYYLPLSCFVTSLFTSLSFHLSLPLYFSPSFSLSLYISFSLFLFSPPPPPISLIVYMFYLSLTKNSKICSWMIWSKHHNFPVMSRQFRISRENSSRSLLATYFWELEKVPDLGLVFENKMARNSRSSRLGFCNLTVGTYRQTNGQ